MHFVTSLILANTEVGFFVWFVVVVVGVFLFVLWFFCSFNGHILTLLKSRSWACTLLNTRLDMHLSPDSPPKLGVYTLACAQE